MKEHSPKSMYQCCAGGKKSLAFKPAKMEYSGKLKNLLDSSLGPEGVQQLALLVCSLDKIYQKL